jgi:glycosyltransferase involved in cell wall biosynthesis
MTLHRMATRLHVVALPHTQVTCEFSACAYTQKVRRFVPMMQAQGFDVELHQPITREEQQHFGFNGPQDYLKIDFNPAGAIWQLANERLIAELAPGDPNDVLCLITGIPHQSLIDAVAMRSVEFGIGYSGIANGTFRIFESHAWRSYVYGWQHADGAAFDDVIPNAFEIENYPVIDEPDDYYAFVGRLNANKGLGIAQQVCEERGARLVIGGPGVPQGYGEFRGQLSADEMIKVVAHAKAVFVPTQYFGPFETIHVDAQLCGTPVITTDWGVFTETVTNGVNGYRCKMYRDFAEAATLAPKLNRQRIARDARKRYSFETVGGQYKDYFERLATLSGRGYYES